MQERIEKFIAQPRKALCTLALPIIIGMIVQVMYNIVDTAFVGRLGAEAIAALTFSFPLFFVLISLNSGISVGMNSRISRYLGEKDFRQAENTAMHGLLISLVFGTAVFILGMIFLKQLFLLFGASNSVLILALGYMRIILVAIFFMFPAYVFNSIFSAQGDTKTPMKIQITTLILNMVLDPIFIYFLGLGVKGAATATLISFVLALILSFYFIKKKSYLKIKFSSFKYTPALVKEIFKVGFPATLMLLLMSIYYIFINRLMAYFGVTTVAAFGIVSRLESVAVMPVVGFAIALLTLIAMFYGAKRYDLLKKITWDAIKIMLSFTIFIGFLFFLFPRMFLILFTNQSDLLDLASNYIRVEVLVFPFIVITMVVSRALQGMGYGLPGLIINLCRLIVVALPLAYIFVYMFNYGYLSIAVATIIGGIVSSIIAVVWLELKIKKINTV